MQGGGLPVASSGVVQGVTSAGGLKRRSPRGGAAKGMPVNWRAASRAAPCTGPRSVWTSVGPGAGGDVGDDEEDEHAAVSSATRARANRGITGPR